MIADSGPSKWGNINPKWLAVLKIEHPFIKFEKFKILDVKLSGLTIYLVSREEKYRGEEWQGKDSAIQNPFHFITIGHFYDH